MASSSPLDCCRRHLPALPSRLHGSKAQAALAKIIGIISTVPPALPTRDPSPPVPSDGVGDPEAARTMILSGDGLGFSVDLGLRLGPWKEIGGGGSRHEDEGPTACSGVVDAPAPVGSFDESAVEEEEEEEEGVNKAPSAKKSISPAESAAGDVMMAEKSSEGECDPEEVGVEQVPVEVEEGAEKHTDGVQDDPSKERGGGGAEEEAKERGTGGEGYLDLLLEAVRQVSGGLSSEESKEKEIETPSPSIAEEERKSKDGAEGAKRMRTESSWTPMDYYEDTGPVVRSKRGRSQTLPSRYRDSVLDPWRKLPTANRPARAAKP